MGDDWAVLLIFSNTWGKISRHIVEDVNRKVDYWPQRSHVLQCPLAFYIRPTRSHPSWSHADVLACTLQKVSLTIPAEAHASSVMSCRDAHGLRYFRWDSTELKSSTQSLTSALPGTLCVSKVCTTNVICSADLTALHRRTSCVNPWRQKVYLLHLDGPPRAVTRRWVRTSSACDIW